MSLFIYPISSFSVINVALKKNATQSSIFADFEHGNREENAVDGDTNPENKFHHCSHTKANRNAWWTVDFGSTLFVGSLKIYNRKDDPGW